MFATAAVAAELPYVRPEMNSPDYWILKHPSPDMIVMAPEKILDFNQQLCAAGLCDDLAALPSVLPGDRVRGEVQALAGGLQAQKLFRADGTNADGSFYLLLTGNMGMDVLPEKLPVRYAFTVAFTDERLLPTDDPLYEKPGDVSFDQLQNSGLDPATPVVVLHESADKKWLFIKDGIAAGWVKRENVAFSDRGSWLKIVTGQDMAVVISARTSVYLDGRMSGALASVRMGMRFLIKRVRREAVEVMYPMRHEDGTVRFVSAFLPSQDVTQGFLPYTPRMVITQAFKLLNAPYGWGDMQGYQDCSRYMQMVFASMGLFLPRNSGEQGRSGLSLAEFQPGALADDKFAVIAREGVGALTLLRLKGHIMLYLGKDEGRLYAIHAIWAYRQKGLEGDEATVLGRVVVSDLSLGEGASRGSLLERIVAVRLLKNADPQRGVKDNH